jgi:hypothetical protein
MTWQIEHDTKLGMSETPGEPRRQEIDIPDAIIPGITVQTGGGDSVVRLPALLQIEQCILKSPQTRQRGRHSTGDLRGISAAHLTSQRRALDAQTLLCMHGRVIPPCTLQLMAGGFQQQALAAYLA